MAADSADSTTSCSPPLTADLIWWIPSAQVPIDMLGEADGGGGGKGAGSEKLREKQREIERLNALLPKS